MSVYYVSAPEIGMVKIGYAENPAHRFSKMQVDSPTRLILVAIEPGGEAIENARHRQFASCRARGEWFRHEDKLAEHIRSLPPYARPQREALPGALGAWLRRNNHTLASFAVLVSSTEATISRICAGKQFPRRDVMLRIVEATNWEVDANALLSIPQRPRNRIAA